VNDRQIVLAAEVSIAAADFGQLGPMFKTTLNGLAAQGVTETPEAVLADAGYWHTAQMQSITDSGTEVLLPPDGNMREGKRRGWEDGRFQAMRDKLSTDRGRELYAQRKITIEPVFGQIKYNRRIDRFMRRGRSAAQSEWRLVTATPNLRRGLGQGFLVGAANLAGVERVAAEAIYDSGREACVEFILGLAGEVGQHADRLKRLEEAARQDSRTSSKPPSSDPPKTRQQRRAEARAKARELQRRGGAASGGRAAGASGCGSRAQARGSGR